MAATGFALVSAAAATVVRSQRVQSIIVGPSLSPAAESGAAKCRCRRNRVLCASVWGLVSPRPAKASLRPQGRGLPCTGGLAPTEGPPRRIVMGGKRCCPVRASKPRSTTVRFSRSLVGASLTSSGAGVSIACPGHTVWRHAATHAGAYAAMVWATWPVPVSVRDRFLLQWSATGAVSAVVWAPRLVSSTSATCPRPSGGVGWGCACAVCRYACWPRPSASTHEAPKTATGRHQRPLHRRCSRPRCASQRDVPSLV
jgi:hypothetical protein